MEGRLLDSMFLGTHQNEMLIAADIHDKKSIRFLEKSVKNKTGLGWIVTSICNETNLILWKCFVPIRSGKLEIAAQSNRERPTALYGFHVEDSDIFMKALKQIEMKR